MQVCIYLFPGLSLSLGLRDSVSWLAGWACLCPFLSFSVVQHGSLNPCHPFLFPHPLIADPFLLDLRKEKALGS